MELVILSEGRHLIRQGSAGDSLYVVLEGQLEITQTADHGEAVQLRVVRPGGSVGELALLTGERRSASVRAYPDAVVARFGREAIDQLRLEHPDAFTRFTQVLVKRIQQAELGNLLFVSGLFKDLSHEALRDLESELEPLICPSGERLIEEGEDSDCIYIVVSGRLRVTDLHGAGGYRVVSELGRGQTVGEMGVLTGRKRAATVSAIRDTLVARLSAAAFKRLLRKHPEAMVAQFAGHVINRLWLDTLGKPGQEHTVVNIAVIPITNGLQITELCRRVAEALASHGSTLHLNSELLDAYLSPSGVAQTPKQSPDSGNIARWLNRQESQYRYILYETDPWPSEWTGRCLRQADRILLVADADCPATPGEVEEVLSSDPRYRNLPRNLLIVHRGVGRGWHGTEGWLTHREIGSHYHICPSEPGDLARLARLLSGRGVGLVLSGGGARGFAHIGGIRALHEAQIPIDRVGGTSIGAIIAAMTAMRWDYETMLGQARSFNYRLDYTYPLVALTAGKTFTGELRRRLGDLRIEDLWINLFCLSTDLSHSRQCIHDRGPLWKYVRASASIPGLFPPVIEGQKFLIDGSVANNLPVDVMRGFEDIGRVIAFDVSTPELLQTEVPIEGTFSGWQAFARRLNPFERSPPLPSLAQILILSALTKSTGSTEQMRNLSDLYVRFPLEDYRLLDFSKIREIAERGYTHACGRIREWDRGHSTDNLSTITEALP
jgi:NTE family protein/lysophospholipid hydrolase